MTILMQTARKRGAIPTAAFLIFLFGVISCSPESVFDPAIECSSCEEWNIVQDPFLVHGNTWYVGTAGLSSVMIVSGDELVLIDGALPQSAPFIVANITRAGFDVRNVVALLNSHAHFDHAGGLAALQRLSGAPVYGGANARAVLGSGVLPANDPQYGMEGFSGEFPAIEDARSAQGGITFGTAELTITPISMPGHTPGGMSYSWESCDADGCVDIVYADSLYPISAEGFRFSDPIDGIVPAEQIRAGIATLRTLSCDVLLSPHPSGFSMEDKLLARNEDPASKPFIDNGCAAYAAFYERKLGERLLVELQDQLQPCSDDWNRLIDDVLQSGDGQGHGPDLGSAEWQSVIEFRLGVRDDPELPDAGSDAWCTEIDSRVRAR